MYSVGHGKSEGSRVLLKNPAEDLVRDVLQHVKEIQAVYPNLPTFIFGHSLVNFNCIKLFLLQNNTLLCFSTGWRCCYFSIFSGTIDLPRNTFIFPCNKNANLVLETYWGCKEYPTVYLLASLIILSFRKDLLEIPQVSCKN